LAGRLLRRRLVRIGIARPARRRLLGLLLRGRWRLLAAHLLHLLRALLLD